MPGTVLVTGGFGLVGSATVRRLSELGRRVVVADLDTPANRKAAAKLPPGVTVRWADLTNADQTSRLVTEVGARGAHPPGGDHPAVDLQEPRTGPAGQRRRHGDARRPSWANPRQKPPRSVVR